MHSMAGNHFLHGLLPILNYHKLINMSKTLKVHERRNSTTSNLYTLLCVYRKITSQLSRIVIINLKCSNYHGFMQPPIHSQITFIS